MPPEEQPVLGFDTSSKFCSAAIVQGRLALAYRNENIGRGHDERLFPLIETLLEETGFDWKDFAAIGAGTGPGSFTGTRISVAAARGLSMSLDIPAVGVTRFEALRFGISRPVLASVDAGRGQVYLQRTVDSEPRVLNLDDIRFENSPAAVVGHEAERIAASLGIANLQNKFPVAVAVARVAALRMRTWTAAPAPVYINRHRETRSSKAQIPQGS